MIHTTAELRNRLEKHEDAFFASVRKLGGRVFAAIDDGTLCFDAAGLGQALIERLPRELRAKAEPPRGSTRRTAQDGLQGRRRRRALQQEAAGLGETEARKMILESLGGSKPPRKSEMMSGSGAPSTKSKSFSSLLACRLQP